MNVTNVNVATGIHYGVIHSGKVDFWIEQSEATFEFDCPFCGEPLGEDIPPKCPACKAELNEEDFSDVEVAGFVFKEDEYYAVQDASDTDIFVISSPYYTMCRFCSPCAPGAGDLLAPGNACKAYCLGHEWFEHGAPYKVFRVSTNEEVLNESSDHLGG